MTYKCIGILRANNLLTEMIARMQVCNRSINSAMPASIRDLWPYGLFSVTNGRYHNSSSYQLQHCKLRGVVAARGLLVHCACTTQGKLVFVSLKRLVPFKYPMSAHSYRRHLMTLTRVPACTSVHRFHPIHAELISHRLPVSSCNRCCKLGQYVTRMSRRRWSNSHECIASWRKIEKIRQSPWAFCSFYGASPGNLISSLYLIWCAALYSNSFAFLRPKC